MGTNYYLHTGICPSCGRPESIRHIGKSSGGWCFALHIYPGDGIMDLSDWVNLFKERGSKIVDEYRDSLRPQEMVDVITDRSWPPVDYTQAQEFLDQNQAQPGPNNLLRHRLSNSCIAHGKGTWDLIVGDFS